MPPPTKISQVLAWVSVSPCGEEGVLVVEIDGTRYPLIGSDRPTIEGYRPMADQVAADTGWQVLLVQFGTRAVLEDLTTAGSA